jgi:hypothetical protein
MKKTIYYLIAFCILGSTNVTAQWWPYGGLINGTNGHVLGTSTNHPINIFTNNINTARFSTGNSLGAGSLIPGIGLGDGLRIMPRTNNCGSPSYPSGSTSSVDIWTSCSDGTNIRWDGSGQISGTNNRFEIWANYMGLFFNTASGSGVYKFARTGTVTAFVGTNNFWRIGQQTDLANISGNRRLEVADDNWQLRLSRTNGSQYTDFQSNANGNLQILPQGGSVGVNLNANPTANLDVNGNARIRNVQVATPNSILVGVNA